MITRTQGDLMHGAEISSEIADRFHDSSWRAGAHAPPIKLAVSRRLFAVNRTS